MVLKQHMVRRDGIAGANTSQHCFRTEIWRTGINRFQYNRVLSIEPFYERCKGEYDAQNSLWLDFTALRVPTLRNIIFVPLHRL